MAADSEDGLYVAERLLGTVRDELQRADTKASVLLSGALALPALLFSGRWSADRLAGGWLGLFVAGGLLWAAGTAFLVLTILPRTWTTRIGPGVTFFGDARSVPAPEVLRLAISAAGRDRVGWLITQLLDVCAILAAKYRCLRWAIFCLLPALVLCGAALTAVP
ncbi:Pycsar system effector family protein [Streptomyces sp. CBMA29]|uniref:Pycsar system effector family protein n=1 Tax=Streptomyces sp. CBMA29 TaxID=1896314 RepID=UPI001661CBEA|nr:Pycsar system effector family protein [Streptomyces sp. CBMA29]MBD0738511.1 hypothetical protein [Streptomyces sp. CBMA29]